MDRNTRIIQKIEDLETQLRDLKLELKKETESPKSPKERAIKIGEEVRILNPRAGQGRTGREW